MWRDFERMMANYCAPTLMGMKAGNIFSVPYEEKNRVMDLDNTYNRQLNPHGIYIEILCLCERRALIYVYRREDLWRELHRKEQKEYLESLGYEVSGDIYSVLQTLKERIGRKGEFPHEIGVFLSYPMEDIRGFIRFKGKEFKINGYWKVYGDVHKTKGLFESFSRCRKIMCEGLSQGKNLNELLYVA